MKTKMRTTFLIGLLLFGFSSCKLKCEDKNPPPCPANPESYIIIKFDMDSLNGGFTLNQLKNVDATFAREFYTEKKQKVVSFIGFDYSNYIFKVMYSFYCCTTDNAGIKIFNNNTGTKHIISNVNFTSSVPNECCGTYYYVNNYKFDNTTLSKTDTVTIKNN